MRFSASACALRTKLCPSSPLHKLNPRPRSLLQARIDAFMRVNDVVFHGAAEPELPHVRQSWDVRALGLTTHGLRTPARSPAHALGPSHSWQVRHMNEARRRANLHTLKGLAAILLEFPDVHCDVHGETGRASSAPAPLARHLGLHPSEDVREAMDVLAQSRAQASVAELAALWALHFPMAR